MQAALYKWWFVSWINVLSLIVKHNYTLTSYPVITVLCRPNRCGTLVAGNGYIVPIVKHWRRWLCILSWSKDSGWDPLQNKTNAFANSPWRRDCDLICRNQSSSHHLYIWGQFRSQQFCFFGLCDYCGSPTMDGSKRPYCIIKFVKHSLISAWSRSMISETHHIPL